MGWWSALWSPSCCCRGGGGAPRELLLGKFNGASSMGSGCCAPVEPGGAGKGAGILLLMPLAFTAEQGDGGSAMAGCCLSLTLRAGDEEHRGGGRGGAKGSAALERGRHEGSRGREHHGWGRAAAVRLEKGRKKRWREEQGGAGLLLRVVERGPG